jgi:4-hydroxythreonine-4-phosphate dehydrogenase
MNKKTPTGIIIGDALGIGPEITVKALSDPALYRACKPILIGDADTVQKALQLTEIAMEVYPVQSLDQAVIEYPRVNIIDVASPELRYEPWGKISPIAGCATVTWFKRAIELAESGKLRSIVYAPINKEAIHSAGFDFSDETDIIETFSTEKIDMLLILSMAGSFRTASVPPLHLSLKKACEALNKDVIVKSLNLLYTALRNFGITHPVIGVSALNPHGGESGLHGDEEIRIIGPAVEDARNRGIDACGPFPPDTVYLRGKQGEFDCVLGMFHDQTRIAMKLVSFKKIIYTVLGTSIQFLSVAHGTANDIAGKGIADAGNFKGALRYASRIRSMTDSPTGTH